MVPNGVAIARPPENSAPPGLVWQAMQSPARARYSPFAITAASSARAAVAPSSMASSTIPRIVTTPISVRLAAARQRHWQRALGQRRRVRRDRPRRYPGRDGGDVGLGQAAGDGLHAVGRDRAPRAIAKRPQLRADVA